VSLEQQARYTSMAYQRAAEEWPWMGVINTWYFKRATDEWQKQGRPEAYFRLADPDFTLQPVYDSLKRYMTGVQPALYPGLHEPLGWGVETTGEWQALKGDTLPFGHVWQSAEPGATLSFDFRGTELALQPACTETSCDGRLRVTVDGGEPVEIAASDATRLVTVARGLSKGMHRAVVEIATAPAAITAINVRNTTPAWLPWLIGVTVAALVLILVGGWLARLLSASRHDIPQAAGWRDSPQEHNR
jgi:hypothetical protein